MNRVVLLVALVVACGCTPEKREEVRKGPIRFAVIAAPEIGTDDTLLALAVSRLSREQDLAFVIVPGPLLAKNATKDSLELLRDDLGQLAPPVYVAFASVTSGNINGCPSGEDVLTGLESLGPGPKHEIAYHREPKRAPGVVVNVLGPDGKNALEKRPESTRFLVTVSAVPTKLDPLLAPEIAIGVAETLSFGNVPTATANGTTRVCAGLLLTKGRIIALGSIWPDRLEIEYLALEGEAPIAPPPVKFDTLLSH